LIGDPNNWGKGIGSEITMLTLHHAFYELNLKRVSSYQLEGNHASIGTHRKCGFAQEGVLRDAIFKEGSMTNLNLMGILKKDFDNHVLRLIEALPSTGEN